ncbi:MAG: peptidylprolyl isomerase [Clostridia bacterium]|nr:peptidylprolyl isomerase [Clostridia bacterium]
MRKSRLLSAVIAVCVLIGIMSGCTVVDNTVIATVNGEDITKAEVVLYFIQVQNNMLSQAGITSLEEAEAYWEIDSNADKAREDAANEAVKTVIKCQKATEQGIALTEEEKSQINQQIGSQITQMGGKTVFEGELKAMGTTEAAYTKFVESMYLASKLDTMLSEKDEYIVSEADAEARIKETYIKAKHILISTIDNTTGAALSDEEVAAAKTQADDLYQQIKGGADFDELMNTYSSDPGLQSSPDGYEFGKGQMVPEFEKTAYALEIGEVSEPVETSYGYHIIKREALSLTADKIAELLPTEVQIMQYEKLNAAYDEWKATAKVEIKEKALSKLEVMQ